jgi:hypothetical protein
MICKVAQDRQFFFATLASPKICRPAHFLGLLIAMSQRSTESRFFVSIQVANLGSAIDLRLVNSSDGVVVEFPHLYCSRQDG